MPDANYKSRPKISVILLIFVLAFFLCLQCYFTYKNYLQEKEYILKNINEGLRNSVLVYKTFSHNKKRIEQELSETLIDPDTLSFERKSENLVRNPDFDTDLIVSTNYTRLPLDAESIVPNSNGWYWITENPETQFPQWKGKGWGGNKRFMLVDGSLLNDNSVWSQEIKTVPNTNYCFRFWISSLALSTDSAPQNNYWQRALLTVTINNQKVGTVLAPSEIHSWQLFQTTWNSGADTSASIVLNDLNTGSNYNDFGIDHLEFYKTGDTLPDIPNTSKTAAFLVNPTIDKIAIESLFKDELELRGLELNYTLLFVDLSEKTSVTNSSLPDKILTSNNCFVNGITAVKCEVRDYTGYLLLRIAIQLILVLVSLSFSVLLVILIRRFLVKQEQVTRLKYEITNNITHELKTPVSTILAAIDMLKQYQQTNNTEKTAQYTEMARIQALRLNSLIDRAMEIAMLENNDFNLLLRETDLNKLVQQVVSSERFVLASNLRITYHAEGRHFVTKADTFHLTNVLHTLLENAIKYCILDPIISIELTEEKNAYRINIRDNGIGIAKQYQRFVFEKYFRVPDSDQHNQKGYGLGLNYVKTIMHLHNGSVALESDGKTGTQITLLLGK